MRQLLRKRITPRSETDKYIITPPEIRYRNNTTLNCYVRLDCNRVARSSHAPDTSLFLLRNRERDPSGWLIGRGTTCDLVHRLTSMAGGYIFKERQPFDLDSAEWPDNTFMSNPSDRVTRDGIGDSSARNIKIAGIFLPSSLLLRWSPSKDV